MVHAMSAAIERSDISAEHRLGTRHTDEGGNVHTYVRAAANVSRHDAVELAEDFMCVRVSAFDDQLGSAIAVACCDLEEGRFGWVLRSGRGLCNLERGLNKNASLGATRVAGRLGPSSPKTLISGILSERATTAHGPAPVALDFPAIKIACGELS